MMGTGIHHSSRGAKRHRLDKQRYSTAHSTVKRFQRLFETLQLLQLERTFNTADLAARLGVCRRTIFRDIRLLQDSGVQIILDAVNGGYRLPHRLSLPRSEIDQIEALSLILICHERGAQDRDASIRSAARRAVDKLCQRLSSQTKKLLEEFTDVDGFNSYSNASAESSDVFRCVWLSFSERRSVRVTFTSQKDGQEEKTLFDPYRIFFTRDGWYIIGRSHAHREVRILDASLIREIEVVDNPFEIDPKFRVKQFIARRRPLPGKKRHLVEVVIHFAPYVARHVAAADRDDYGGQRILDDGTLEYRTFVEDTESIVNWVLSFGEFAEVLQPESLRNCIKRHAANLVRMYTPTGLRDGPDGP